MESLSKSSPAPPQTGPESAFSTPSRTSAPKASPPPSAKVIEAPAVEDTTPKESQPMGSEDRELLERALSKITELEGKLKKQNSQDETPDADDKSGKTKNEDDEEPIVTPDGQKVS